MSKALWRSPFFVLVCGSAIIVIAYGSRQSFGMFLRPVTEAMGWGQDVRVMSLSTGLMALMYGFAAPFVGAIADRWGPIRVFVGSALIYAMGLIVMAQATTAAELIIGIGVLIGLGSSGISLSMIMSVVGRVAPPSRRTFWLSVVVSAGTAGQMLIVPLSNRLISGWGWVNTTMVLLVLVLLILPLSFAVRHAAKETLQKKDKQSLGQAIREAAVHRGFWLLVTGFFVCGFQVQFINNHFENYLNATAVGGAMAATAISLIGLFNLFGTQIAGFLSVRYRPKYLLSCLYTVRSLVFLVFFLTPVSRASVIIFACTIGLLWLATVPLTSGIVAGVFGPRYLATLYGVVFLSHQVGSFSSVYLGGIIRTYTGSYDYAWWMIIGAGFVAALLHWPIDDKPVPRLAAEHAAA